MAFFASPAKPWLINKLQKRSQNALQPKEIVEHPLMGLPSDPAEDIDAAMREIKEEVKARRRRGQIISMPTGGDMKAAIEDRRGKKI